METEVPVTSEGEVATKIAVTHRCMVCATDMHIETFDGEDWWVCDDIACQWMEPV